ncbi:putative GTP diphosphokinase RSH1, chloroplastic [Zea mays]|uniref:Putative GTP diphosphokinase RSH1, chloroplastic n=2 Tax=Zea mays TaxID=4577 RepID=A0A3L6D6W9_MAIZE|nr:putative GTP diphosphokinase RSH1, chloroplastic [Zea mays]PWZ19856.1 putative GTP diphosphokinase RSH1, chloroplastic [Zea mays]
MAIVKDFAMLNLFQLKLLQRFSFFSARYQSTEALGAVNLPNYIWGCSAKTVSTAPVRYYFLMFEILRFQANRILRQKIAEDQFLDHVSVETEVRSVYKELYSIYKTTLKSKSSINEVNQVAQLRIIIKSKSCNGVGPLCTAQQVKDYIATPKPNGYQSLHTTAIPFLNESMFHLEVQSLELSGSDIGGGYELYVDEAKPRGDDQRGGGRSGGRSGGRFGDRSGGRRGGGRFGERSGGKDGGGRFDGRRGGRDGSRGRGGRGFVNKQSAGTPSVGKKTTFGDD